MTARNLINEKTQVFNPEESEFDDYSIFKRDSFNRSRGYLAGRNCLRCNNKGFYMHLRKENGHIYEVLVKCDCATSRSCDNAIEKSGLKTIMQNYTFESFLTPEEWQIRAKETALKYLHNHEHKWFYMGGQNGSGKTHLCKAIVGELLKSGFNATYMMWRNEVVTLKAEIMSPAYHSAMQKLKTVQVLYIDDFY